MTLVKTRRVNNRLFRSLVQTALCGIGSLTLSVFVSGQQTVGSFQCNSHTVAIDRMPGARFVPIQPPSQTGPQKIFETDFSALDPKSSLDSVHFDVLFVQDQTNQALRVGKLRILVRLRGTNGEQWRELIDGNTKRGAAPEGWFTYEAISDRLRVRVEPTSGDDASSAKDDPLIEGSGRPQIRIHQAAPRMPLFLLKYIGLTRAGGWGDVDTEQAIVLDLRDSDLTAPAAVGCVKNDFAGQNHEDESIECLWNPRYEDYVCRTNAYYERDWDFLLIQSRKLPTERDLENTEPRNSRRTQ